MKNTAIPRLLLCQQAHADKWRGAVAGNWGIITPGLGNDDGQFKDAGRTLTACILASRDTAMRVQGWYSFKPAAIKVHDRTTSEYKAITREAQDTSSYCLEGLEVLLHTEEFGLLTYFAGRQATKYLRKALADSNARTNHTVYPNLYPVFRMKAQKTTNWQSGFQFSDLKWQLVTTEAQETLKLFTSAYKTTVPETPIPGIEEYVTDLTQRAARLLRYVHKSKDTRHRTEIVRNQLVKAITNISASGVVSLWPDDLVEKMQDAVNERRF